MSFHRTILRGDLGQIMAITVGVNNLKFLRCDTKLANDTNAGIVIEDFLQFHSYNAHFIVLNVRHIFESVHSRWYLPGLYILPEPSRKHNPNSALCHPSRTFHLHHIDSQRICTNMVYAWSRIVG